MDNYLETIKQLQLTIQLVSDENKELSQKLLQLQDQHDPESDLQISNLEKTVLLQQQEIAQLMQENIKTSRVSSINNEQEYEIGQLNDLINNKESELSKLEDLIYQTEFSLRNTQQEFQELKEALTQKQKQQIQINQKAEQLEKIIQNISGQDSLPMSYINEIDRLNVKLQNLEKSSTLQSRVTYQSYYKYN